MTFPHRRQMVARVLLTCLVYAGMAVGSAYVHDDPVCHQQTSTHCASCSYTATSAAVADDSPAWGGRLTAAGSVGDARRASPATAPPATTSDRSPPRRSIG